jgi:UrcA family protein
MFRKWVPMLLGSAALTLSAHAHSSEATAVRAFEAPSKTISLADLDLGEPGHLPIVYTRVQRAAAAVCDSSVRAERNLRRRVPAGWRDACVRSAVDAAVRRFGDRRLTSLHGDAAQLLAGPK